MAASCTSCGALVQGGASTCAWCAALHAKLAEMSARPDLRVSLCWQCGIPVTPTAVEGYRQHCGAACTNCGQTRNFAPRTDETVQIPCPPTENAASWESLKRDPRRYLFDEALSPHPPPGYEHWARADPRDPTMASAVQRLFFELRQRSTSAPADTEANRALHWCARYSTTVYLMRGQPAGARPLLEEALDLSPRPKFRYLAYCNLSVMALNAGDVDSATYWLDRCDPRPGYRQLFLAASECRLMSFSVRGAWDRVLELVNHEFLKGEREPLWVTLYRAAALDAVADPSQAQHELTKARAREGDWTVEKLVREHVVLHRLAYIFEREEAEAARNLVPPSNKAPPPKDPVGLMVGGFGMAAVGLGMWIYSMVQGAEAIETTFWKAVPGAYQQADVTRETSSISGTTNNPIRGSGSIRWLVHARYAYKADGFSYTGTDLTLGNDVIAAYADRKAAVRHAASMTGTKVHVYYNPNDPKRSVLQPGFEDEHVMLIGTAGVLFSLAAGMVARGLRVPQLGAIGVFALASALVGVASYLVLVP